MVRASRTTLAFSTIGDDGNVLYEPYSLNSGISLAANLREAFQTAPLLGQSYGTVLVMVDSPHMVVPVDLYREDQRETLFRHAFTEQEQQVVVSAVLPELHGVALFSVGRDFHTVTTDHWPQARFLPVCAPVWNHLHQRSYTGPRAKLYAYFHERQVEVFSFGQNRFKFCNSFAFSQADDVLYYLLSVWKQLGMSADRDELHLAGDYMAQAGGLQQLAEEFVRRVYVVNPVGEFNRAPVTQIPGMPYDVMLYYLKR